MSSAPPKLHVVKLVFKALTLSWCLWGVLGLISCLPRWVLSLCLTLGRTVDIAAESQGVRGGRRPHNF